VKILLDNWFKEDLNKLYNNSDKIVLIDLEKNYDFLVDKIKSEMDIEVYKVDDFLSDLEVKYKVEKNDESKVLIHTNIQVDQYNQNERQYMIQEYAATGAKLDRPLNRYIRDKAGLLTDEHKLSESDLIIAGKMSLKNENNNQKYWQNISHQGKKALLGNFNEVALSFLAEPEGYLNYLPEGGRELLYNLIGEYLDYIPEKDTDPLIVAADFSNTIFKNIILGINDTEEIYKSWLDSHRYRKVLKQYLADFELPAKIDIWQVNPDHPFAEIDELWLNELADLILDNKEINQKIKEVIRIRQQKKEGMELAESHYWKYVYQLLNFKAKAAHKIDDLTEFIEFYKNKLYKLDQAFRHLNKHFLAKNRVRSAFTALYKEKINSYLDRWFDLFGNYRENQSDYLYREIFSQDERKAVIIGDAVSFEVSQEILEHFFDDKSFNNECKVINGAYPSTTENNMSALFDSPVYKARDKREKYLADKLEEELQIFNIDSFDISEISTTQPAVIYGRDIDMLSEEGHEAALKYYSTFINTIVEKIKELLNAGYVEVHLTTDHGFVCNFDIDEADKFAVPVNGKIGDRYVQSDEYKPESNDFHIQENKGGEHKYTYYPKGIDPVKSRGQYGFSHGGITPQEVLLPHLIFRKESSSQLQVSIENKEQLKSIGANSFAIKIKAAEESDLFSRERDILIQIENDGEIAFSQERTITPAQKDKIELQLSLNRYKVLIKDAQSKEILDSVKGKKEQLRGGLDGFDLN